PEPTPEPATELDTQPISEPAPEPAPKPAPEPATEPAPEPIPVPATEPAPEPASEPVPEPATDSCPEPAPESCPKPSPAPHLLQCPVITPKTGLKTAASPRTPVPLSSIKFAHFETVDLSQVVLAETSCRNLCHSFCVITPQRKLILAAPNRKDMEEWINVIKTVQQGEIRKIPTAENNPYLIGMHYWYSSHSPRTQHCNVCRESIRALSRNVITCEVCKVKSHRLCALRASKDCKWNTLSITDDLLIPADEIETMPHQWVEGNISVSSQCAVCHENCGSNQRLQDFRCLWCNSTGQCQQQVRAAAAAPITPQEQGEVEKRSGAIRVNSHCSHLLMAPSEQDKHQALAAGVSSGSGTSCGVNGASGGSRCEWDQLWQQVHDDCRRRFSKECWFGRHRKSIIPPTALSDPKADGQLVVSSDFWNLDWSSACSCPLLIFINSKSGDHQGVIFLRKFKQYLNPSQVFDLSKGGPEAGLSMFKNFTRFRIVVCGGDGSVSWVLSLIDALGLHERCQLAVIPLGTGNDLARVLGWGAFWNKNKSPLNILNRVEQASVRILDRWSVMIRETPRQTPLLRGQVEMDIPQFEAAAIQHLESASTELNKILKAKYPTEMIIPTRFLCSAVEDFVIDIVKTWSQIKQNNATIESVILKSDLIYDKLNVLIDVLAEEAAVEKSATVCADSSKAHGKPFAPQIDHIAKCKLELATKAKNLQKSLKLIVFQVEQVLDEQSRQMISVKNFTSTFPPEDDSEDISQTSPRHRSRCGILSSIPSLTSEDLDNLNLEHLHFTPETICFKEKCVMNNYFGIGLDAKISLEFNTRRDEHPGQYNSRLKNKMWYGLLGSKELLQRSYRNLEERVHLECDGEAISLPNLQGIVVLNITSYAGGINFWGSSTATTEYEVPAIDDGKLEVVAIFGSVQMAMSRIINLHHHRIAQCREVMITIDGEEGIPVQVDGEAWVQRPGLIKIRYKNAAQMLTRDQLDSQESQDSLSDEESAQIQHLAQLAENLISRLTNLSKVHQHVSVLMDSVNASAKILDDTFNGQDSSNEAAAASFTPIETLSRNDAVDVTFSLKGLYDDTRAFLEKNLLRNAEDEATLQITLDAMNEDFEKLSEINWMNSVLFPEEKSSDTDSRNLGLKVKFPKSRKKKLEEEDKPKSGQGVQGFIAAAEGTKFPPVWTRLISLGLVPTQNQGQPSKQPNPGGQFCINNIFASLASYYVSGRGINMESAEEDGD
ncbi:Diacylglycerol kinase kappa, partial [Myotis davidii]